jgi:MraZ protein
VLFTGKFERQLDEKGRLVLPPVFRGPLADGCHLSRPARERFLSLVTDEQLQRQADRLEDLVRRREVSGATQRLWFASIVRASVDGQGRITVPPNLREQVGIDTEVVVVGNNNRIELWGPEQWDRELADAPEQPVESWL